MASAAHTNPSMFETSDPTTPAYYAPSQTALLLLDFHEKFVERAGASNGPAALHTAASMRSWAKSHGVQVIHCLVDIHGTPHPTCKGSDRVRPILAAMAKGSGGEESTELTKDYGDDERTFARQPGHVSALKSPGLEEHLQSNGIKSLILAGLSTSGCALRTALAACDAEYVVTVVSDGCADGQGLHDPSLKAVEMMGYVATAAEIQEGYTKVEGWKKE